MPLDPPKLFDVPMTKSMIMLLGPTMLALSLAGCAGEGPVKTVAEVAGIATTPQEAKSFVQQTRPVDPAYIPINKTIAVNPLCAGPTPPPAYTPTGQAARFTAPVPDQKPTDPCKRRAEFKQIESQLEARRIANDAAGSQAVSLGKALPAPAPAAALPTN
ncbi:hypothetical protein J2Y55_001860 [Bosea sp. BE125]|uniref:hypothetical protein n=1 Tax=Bosea sp. BE125 TaxID=2817909 RepID=UPI002862BB26|nr:hypothetical protein [Bosea sp. BE125]MDR6870852.1 hypothetical protein [Bosea sp. BE125]